jgi:hypothetical protein
MGAGITKPIGMGSGSTAENAYQLFTRYNGEMGSDVLSDVFSAKQT